MTKRERADEAFEAFCEYFSRKGLKYTRDVIERSIILQVTGEDFPVTLFLRAEEDDQRVFVYSKLPFEVKRDKYVDLVMATTYVNQVIPVGAFCVDQSDGSCSYEYNASFAGFEGVGAEYAASVAEAALSAVEKYNDGLYAVNKGLVTVKEFASKL